MQESVQAFFPADQIPAAQRSTLQGTASQQAAERSSMGTQLVVLFRRGFNDIKRNPMRGKAQLMQPVVMAVILSLIWFQVSNDQNGVQDRSGVLFFITTNGLMQNVMGVLTTFSAERGAVLREQENGMYSTGPYFVSRVLCDIPIKLVGPCLFGTIAYWCVGFQPVAEKYLMFLGFLILLALAGNSLGLFLACIFPDVAVALAVAPVIILPLVMFSGFVLNPESIPVYLFWVEWISPTKYAFAALAQIEFGGLKLHCTDKQMQKGIGQDGNPFTFCPAASGEAVLEKLNIQEILTELNCALLLMVIVVVFKILAYFGLVMVSRKNKAKAVASAKQPKVKTIGSAGSSHPEISPVVVVEEAGPSPPKVELEASPNAVSE
jgi:hypothetical protein